MRLQISSASTLAFLALLFASIPQAYSQEESAAAPKDPVAATGDQEAEAAEAPSFDQLVRSGKLDEAANLLEEQIAADADNAELQQKRYTLAIRYASKRNYAASFEQLDKLFSFTESNAKTPEDAAKLAGYVAMLNAYGSRAGKADHASELLEKALLLCQAHLDDAPDQLLLPTTDLLNQKISKLAVGGDKDEAQAIADQHLLRLRTYNQSDQTDDNSIRAQARMLSLVSRVFDKESAAAYGRQLNEFMDDALERFSDSAAIQTEYGRVKLTQIASGYRDDPQAAQALIEAMTEKLTPYAESNRSVQQYLASAKRYEARIESALKLLEMVGKPAPPIDAAAWVNAEGFNEDSLQGKVVMLDFWAVWCGPCIATFPHLREWREEFADQGFEVVGVTRYYGYVWNEEQEAATRAGEPVEADVEHLAVEKFMQSHDLHHPSIFTPKESTMQQDYAVTGIPHAVLIDRKGVVQMVKVGSGPANAEALHTKIKELIEQ